MLQLLPDSVVGLLWSGTTLLTFVAAWSWGRKLFPEDAPLQCVIHTVVLFWATIVAAGVILGAAGLLYPDALVGVVAVSSLLALWLCRRHLKGGGGLLPIRMSPSAETSPSETAEQSPTAPPASPPPSRSPPARSEKVWLSVWGAVFAFTLAYVVMGGLLRFPTDWDTLMYHIPLVDQWLQARSLYGSTDSSFWYNPGNNELLGLWLVAPFSGDFLVGLNNLPAAVLFAIGAVELAASLGVSRSLSHGTGLVVIACWPLWRQLIDAENDVAVAGLFFISLWYGIRSARGWHPPDLLLASVSLGLLAGTKYYALGYAAVAWACLVGLALACRGRKAAARAAAFGVLGVVLWGGYWYVRNAVLTGTPVYPKGFTPATDLWGEAMRPGSWTSSFLGCGRPEVIPLALEAVWKMTGPLHFGALFLLPVTLGWLVVSGWSLFRRGQAENNGLVRLAFAAVLLGTGLAYVSTPNAVETVPGTMNMLKGLYLPIRFGLCFLSLAVIGAVVLLQDLIRGVHSFMKSVAGGQPSPPTGPEPVGSRPLDVSWLGSVVLFGVLALLCGFQFWHLAAEHRPPGLLDMFLIAVNLFGLGVVWLLCWEFWVRFRRFGVGILVVGVLVGMSVSCSLLSSRWHTSFVGFYNNYFGTQVFSILSKMDLSKDRLCVCDYRCSPYFGSARQINMWRPLWVPDFPAFHAYLREQQVTLIVTHPKDPIPQSRYVNIHEWLSSRPDLFSLVHEDKLGLFRVNEGGMNIEPRGSSEPLPPNELEPDR